MSRHDGLSQWDVTVSTHLPGLSPAQAYVLALWSYGMVLARSCGITSVAVFLAPLLGAKENTVRQRLREWCYDAEDKRGTTRCRPLAPPSPAGERWRPRWAARSRRG